MHDLIDCQRITPKPSAVEDVLGIGARLLGSPEYIVTRVTAGLIVIATSRIRKLSSNKMQALLNTTYQLLTVHGLTPSQNTKLSHFHLLGFDATHSTIHSIISLYVKIKRSTRCSMFNPSRNVDPSLHLF
jgi:hypothetical protein